MHTLIIGAGWAGLSAAIHLAQKDNTRITVLEAAPQAGGRARSVSFGTKTVDNGQHVLMGAYQHFLKLLDILKIPENKVLKRMPFNFYTSQQRLNLKTSPAPLHLLFGLLKAKGFSLSEKMQVFRFYHSKYPARDLAVLDFLKSQHQSDHLIRIFWEPLVLAALTTPISEASTHVFLNVFKQVFKQTQSFSHWLYPKKDLSQLLPIPAIDYLKSKGHEIIFNQRIQTLDLDNNQCIGASTQTHRWRADQLILATSAKTTLKVIQPIPALFEVQNQLQQMQHQPITTVYLQFSSAIFLPHPLIGLIGTTGQWVFDRTLCEDPNIVSVIISGNGPHQELSHTALVEKIIEEIKPYIDLKPIHYKIITEKQAAFSCAVDVEKLRPTQKTPISNLYLAGDYTQTGYPATLEGAVLSGYKAMVEMYANQILKSPAS